MRRPERTALKVGDLPEHLRPLGRLAIARRWRITRTRGGHLKWKPPCGQFVITGSTAERYGHGDRNAKQQLAQAGLVIDPRKRAAA